ncbi:MAG: DEAD/DEAH box helicase [Nannocystis sp.]|uniref:DEAD/DEAH box helicase n=1 Tax=Nannocystis sp. TaxID=1962667 RepID=UPI002427B361|nr:DEAD/DEAH box helicase [Nannocystis sp.]MBK9753653.1 DEAD/DEAH box helicase [Nannocystis sp.]
MAARALARPGLATPGTDARLAAIEAELLAGLNGAAEVVAVHRSSARAGELVAWPEVGSPIDPRLRAALASRGIERPYAHQAAAIAAALAGRDVVLATATASGKSLCFQVPIIQAALADPRARALLLFPTKALARDQLRSLRELKEPGTSEGLIGCGAYDGDTPPDERRAARARAAVIATNPDMLHRGILPHHERWSALLANLRYVVIDELHSYRGVFGSHVANVLRRLWRVCAYHGSRPTIIACSATIANPRELAAALTGRPDFTLVDRDASPAGPRTFVVLNPAVVDPLTGVRRDYLKVTRAATGAFRRGHVATLAFCRTRKAVELLTRYLREDEAGVVPNQSGPGGGVDPIALARAEKRIRGYRGGYLPEHRREVEQALHSGEAQVVATTHALELGMDIGGLDAVVLAGYPGTRAATMQRSGRAGRRRGAALTAMVLSSDPLDQCIAADPGFLFDEPPEHARVDPDNPELLIPHLRCAAYELPLCGEEGLAGVPAEELAPVLEDLAAAGVLHAETDPEGRRRFFSVGESFPADKVDLRSSMEENFTVLEQAPGLASDGRLLAEVDFEDGPLYLHPGAIYPIEGQTFEVVRLDWSERKAYVRAVEATYYTEAVCQLKVRVVAPIAIDEARGRGLGYAHLVRSVPGFKKLRFRSHENVGFGPINLPDLELHTVAAYWTLSAVVLAHVVDPGRRAAAALAVGHALHHGAAMLLMCDVSDLGHAVAASPGRGAAGQWAPVVGGRGRVSQEVLSQASALPCVYLYDNMPGGAGLASQAHALGPLLFERVIRILDGCSCKGGCPTCLGVPRGPVAARVEPAAELAEPAASFGLLGRLRAAQVGRPGVGAGVGPGIGPVAPMLRPIDLRAELRSDALHLLHALREAGA